MLLSKTNKLVKKGSLSRAVFALERLDRVGRCLGKASDKCQYVICLTQWTPVASPALRSQYVIDSTALLVLLSQNTILCFTFLQCCPSCRCRTPWTNMDPAQSCSTRGSRTRPGIFCRRPTTDLHPEWRRRCRLNRQSSWPPLLLPPPPLPLLCPLHRLYSSIFHR